MTTPVQDPNTPKYDNVSGLLTAYGRSLGLPEVNKGNAITSNQLTGAGSSYNLPNPTVPTYGGLPGATEATVTGAKTAAQANLDLLKTNVTDSGNAYLKELLGSAGIPQSVDRAEQDKAKVQSDLYLSQLEQEQLSIRRATEDITKNFQGTTAGMTSAVAAKTRESLSKQADIAILFNSANRAYDTAKSIADRAVEMKLEESRIKLSALKFFYDENKAEFNKQDERLYAEAVKKADAELRKQEEIENKIRDLKLNVANYAGSSAAGILAKLTAIDTKNPKAFDEAVKIAGKYNTDPLDRQIKQATLNKLNTESSGSKVPNITKINGVDKQWDPKTAQWVEPSVSGASSPIDATVTEKSNDDIKKVKSVIADNVALSASAGMKNVSINPFNFNRVNDWRANVKNLLAQTTLAELVRVKGSGVTFGALSEGERQAVADASTALNAAMVYSGKGDSAKATGRFDASESFVKEQLGLIQKYQEIDFKRRTGMSPDDYEAKKYLDTITPALEVVSSPYADYINK